MINGMKQDIHNSLIEQVRISLLKIIKSSVSDFTIESNDAGSDVLIMAIHGGKIEPGTTELARNLSRKYNYNYYSFVGKKSNHNASLHITSTDFREPKAIEMSARSSVTISIHGCAGSNQFTYIGGRDDDLGMKIKAALEKNGFTVLAAAPGLSGKSIRNICNTNRRGQGVQLEISRGLRNAIMVHKKVLKAYSSAIQEAIAEVDLTVIHDYRML